LSIYARLEKLESQVRNVARFEDATAKLSARVLADPVASAIASKLGRRMAEVGARDLDGIMADSEARRLASALARRFESKTQTAG
jgi:hypothetical protein